MGAFFFASNLLAETQTQDFYRKAGKGAER
jgi:hypothetical protein